MADINTLVKELGQLTVLEALELSKKLSKEWNIDLDSLQAAPAQASAPAEAKATATITLTGFAENKKIPVLKADEPARYSRLALCKLTRDILKKGLDLLGISTLERM